MSNRKSIGLPTAGESTCPVCGLTWTVTPIHDCMLPSCGCYGTDLSASNPSRTCQPCGMSHVRSCTKPKTAKFTGGAASYEPR